MQSDANSDKGKTLIEPIQWCRYIVRVAYITAALMILAHVIWYYAARSVLAVSQDVYLWGYIVVPAIGLFVLTFLVDLLVRSPRFSLIVKEILSLSLFTLFSFYLSLTHDIAKVLLGSFILSIFASTIFSSVKITRWIFGASISAVLLLGLQHYIAGKLNSDMVMQIFVACFMFVCAYLLAKVLIRYGHDNLTALTVLDDRQRYMAEQLKLDLFTGLYNRKTFDDSLPRLMEECRNADKYLSLAMIDVDNFKRVNDLFGHAVGDQVLLHLSQILKNSNAENIHAFRLGGDEFTVLFSDCDAEEACRICDEIRIQMESASMQEINHISVTISCGLVCMNPNRTSLEAFKKAADSALYAAKNNGRNQIAIFHD